MKFMTLGSAVLAGSLIAAVTCSAEVLAGAEAASAGDVVQDDVLVKRATTSSSSSKKTSSTKISSSTSAVSSPPACPTIWTTIAADLRQDFVNCSQKAANAIRFAFHDSGGYSSKTKPYGPASGGADGSLLLNTTEARREEHNPMQGFQRYLLGKYQTYSPQGVGAADFVQFAGSLGVTSCAGGPVYKTVVGRTDDASAAPEGLLPVAFGPAAANGVIVQLFADKGFNVRELAALMGAHSVSRSFQQSSNGVPANAPQDSTPQVWDMKYYSETQAKVQPDGVYSFESDLNLANASTASGKIFTEFANGRAAWVNAFAPAMFKLSVLGIPQAKVSTLIDCTAAVRFNATA